MPTSRRSKMRDGIMRLSPQLQCRETDQRQHDSNDPETDHDRGFAPAELFEMMMDRRHAEDALAGQPERDHLDDDRDGLEHEKPTNDGKNDLMLDGNGHGAERATQR